MNSRIYQALTTHKRFFPKPHFLMFKMFLFYLDLDEISLLTQRFFLFSRNRFNFFSFYDKDHFVSAVGDIKSKVADYLKQQNYAFAAHKIMLLTFPRMLGYVFHPVSFYFCFDAQNKCRCAIAEVGNTFKETKVFFIPLQSDGSLCLRTKKYFYVSPFVPLDAEFDFKLQVPQEYLNCVVEDYVDNRKVLSAALSGQAQIFSTPKLCYYFFRYPLMTIGVITSIHWNALLLYLKGITHFAKKENLSNQRDVWPRS